MAYRNKQREHLEPDVYPQDEIGDAAYRICAEFIERLPSAQQWIPCSERLPDKTGRYLVCKSDWGSFEVDVDAYSEEGKSWFTSRGVRAWMPLPDPWKGDEDE